MTLVWIGVQVLQPVLQGNLLVSATVTSAEERPVSDKILDVENAVESAVSLRESWLTPYAK